jgi:hypothetical protein
VERFAAAQLPGSKRAFPLSREGGFLELASSTIVRPPPSALELAHVIPAARGRFSFPAPYGGEAYRITIPADCGGRDCVNSVGYSYWRNINNHAGSDRLFIVLTLASGRGGVGPSLFEIQKATGVVRHRGPLFSGNDERRGATGEGWYFSARAPTMLYAHDRSRLTRVDVLSRSTRVVFDIQGAAAVFGAGRTIWQVHSSNDDAVHSFTVMGEQALGCGVYFEQTGQFRFFPTLGIEYDECQVDRSGTWLLIKEHVDRQNGEDNRIINLKTHDERWLLDEDGAGGHSDMGFASMVAADNWFPSGIVWRLWEFDTDPLGPKTVVYSDPSWETSSINHVSWLNAVEGPAAGQYACGSGATRGWGPRSGEIVCFMLDGSQRAVVVAPVMTDLDARGGADEYWRLPKGNLDVTGEYFIWTSNTGGDRLDAYLVRIPAERLYSSSSTGRHAAPRPGSTGKGR